MQLRKIIEGLTDIEVKGDLDENITGLVCDSRQVQTGFMFIAVKGHSQDGHAFITEAVRKGARALVYESEIDVSNFRGIKIRVPDSRKVLSLLAANFYEKPFNTMNLHGITGTNGKTTTSYIIEAILQESGARPGVMGTISYRFSEQILEAPTTTPEPLALMEILRKMADSGTTDVIMEVSSHALVQGRVDDCPFKTAVFTNLSRDHLDYHGSMDEYFNAKNLLFKGLGKNRTREIQASAVINADDPWGQRLVEAVRAKIVTYGVDNNCDVRAGNIELSRNGIKMQVMTPQGTIEIRSRLIGRFNVYNILAAIASALSMKINLDCIVKGIDKFKGVPGRLEKVDSSRSLIIVDYAHTPDALQKALNALRPVTSGRLITVFGCGGDRDRGKRPEMGKVAAMNSDLVFITSDNPRSENPDTIIEEIEAGVRECGFGKLHVSDLYKERQSNNNGKASGSSAVTGYVIESDRENAIKNAIQIADENDLVFIAGKGHENYQIIGSIKKYFDDRKVASDTVSHMEMSR